MHDLHIDLPFLPERMKVEKYNEFVCNFYDKGKCVLYKRTLKLALSHGLVLEKVHWINFNQKTWLKSYIDVNTKLRPGTKYDFEKDFFKLVKNIVFDKAIENVRKQMCNNKRSYLVSEPNYHTTKWFQKNLLAIKRNRTKVRMQKPVYLGLSILKISKTIMSKFWYDYVKPNHQDKANLCYMNTYSFLISICKRFDTSNYKVDKLLSTGKTKKWIGLMKDELGGENMTEFKAKMHS